MPYPIPIQFWYKLFVYTEQPDDAYMSLRLMRIQLNI